VHHQDEEGATAVEYSLMTGLIAVVVAAAVGTFGFRVNGLFESLTSVWQG
jgi:Flp pilus assembly pilin Flp